MLKLTNCIVASQNLLDSRCVCETFNLVQDAGGSLGEPWFNGWQGFKGTAAAYVKLLILYRMRGVALVSLGTMDGRGLKVHVRISIRGNSEVYC